MNIFLILLFLILLILIFFFYINKPCDIFNYDLFSNNSIKYNYDNLGFVIIPNVFTKQYIDECRLEILNYSKTNNTSIVDFVGRNILPKTSNMKNNSKIHLVLKQIFEGNDYRFCKHNDIGFNRIVNWHKDKLNGPYNKYEKLNIFNKEQNICKVAIYLQDHSNNTNCLRIIPSSQYVKNIDINNCKVLQPKLGDVIIFDQRITHRGKSIFDFFKFSNTPRILVSFGFGKNNKYTDQFEKGTIQRQNDQLINGFFGNKIK